jgi:hypothetical protein
MRTELKKMDVVLAKGNIPKPETAVPPERREDYDRDRYERGDRGDRNTYRGGSSRGFRGGSSNYRGRGGRGGYRH